MRAAVTVSPCRVELLDAPDPAPTPDQALVRMVAVGLCGTDVHMWAGERTGVGFPLRQGHEIAGVVEQLPADGSGRHLAAGDVVAVDPCFPCGRCRICRRGEWPSCAGFTAFGVARPGGLTEAMAVPADHLHRLTDVPAETAALVEPVSVAAMALRRSGAVTGDRIVVLGAGPIGLGLLLCARQAGIAVLIADLLPDRLAVATELGADAVHDAGSEGLATAVAEWSGGDGADAVIEASGSPRALAAAVGLLGRAGTVVVVGLSDAELTVPVSRLLFDGIGVTGSRAGLFPAAVGAVSREPEAAARLISHRFPLSAVAAAFTHAHDHAGTSRKVLVTM